MGRSIVRTLLVSGAALGVGLMASAGSCSCTINSSSTSSTTVPKNDVASQITAKMTDASGNKPQSATCPNDLPKKVGAQLNCTMQFKDGNPVGVNVTVTSINGDTTNFDMAVLIDQKQITNYVNDRLTQWGHNPDSVSCPEDLKGVVGTTLRCTFTESGQTYGVNLKVTSVNGTDVKFDINVEDQPS